MLNWLRIATEYAIGATLVLAHLALAGRMQLLMDTLEDDVPGPRRIR